MARISEDTAIHIVKAAEAEFDMIFDNNPTDKKIGMSMMCGLVELFSQPHFVYMIGNTIAVMKPNMFPTSDKRFCEVLRVFANVLEATSDTEKKGK